MRIATIIACADILFATAAGAFDNSLADDALREAGLEARDLPSGSCVGTLMHMKEGYFLLGNYYRSLCLFNDKVPSYRNIVLKACKVGKKCEVFGAVQPCADDREYDKCTAVSFVKAARARGGIPKRN